VACLSDPIAGCGVSSRVASPDRSRISWVSQRLAWLVSQVARLVPLPLAYWLADRCGDLVYLLLKTYRRNVQHNVALALGPGADAQEVRRVARRVFRNSARNFIDLLRVPHLSPEELIRSIQVCQESWAEFERLATSGQGAVIVTAHLGPFDYVGQLLSARGYRFTSLTTRTVPEFLDAAVNYLRTSRGLRIERATPGGIRRVILALRRGELVGLAADRDFLQNGWPVIFFGKETTLPPGPVRLARSAGVPILAAFTRRLKRGYQLLIEPPFYIERTDDAARDLRSGLQRLIELFERHIREAPDQWVIFQRVWPERPAPVLRVFPVGSPLEGELLGWGADPARPLTEPLVSPTDRMDRHPRFGPESVPQPAEPPG
jgi:KDO2-lipid IV(A) lauroyltransferase